VTVVAIAAEALDDVQRLTQFLRDSEPYAALETATLIADGLRILSRHPLIGRPIEEGKRELVIHRGRTGYVAQYRVDADFDRVLVIGIRHQREAGYGD
jgi:plasmid stabilization system protein ParE